ncbi:hypothetical protein [Xanthomarina sp. F2636L]|uniref:hypothetical protein n=1 Tax=Xanthomarina sp. F2636L TaxID=2996018 RepID=UPI00225E54F2|nr:hypothetical protein [Xanthomarina sp. F2636L]MCX7552100.1 hypothetical protein [Xanthomarina sp. F2636L]
MKLKHIEHEMKIIETNGFFVFNILESEHLNPTISDLLESNLLNEAYFYPKEEIKRRKQEWNEIFGPHSEETDILKIYGSILQDRIDSTDFYELNYKEYLEKIDNYLSEWSDEVVPYLFNTLKSHHFYSIEKLKSENPEKRKFFFMDDEFVEKSKQSETNIYEFFFTIISTLKNSNRIIVMNFGYD